MFYNVELVKITKVDPRLLSYVQLIAIVCEKKNLDKKIVRSSKLTTCCLESF